MIELTRNEMPWSLSCYRLEKLSEGLPKNRRHRLNAVLWVARTRVDWRGLPDYYGHWSSAYHFFWRLQKSGTWIKILEHVAIELDFEQMMFDTKIVRVHQNGTIAK